GFTLERTTRAAAASGIDGEPPLDLVQATRIPLEGSIASPREATRLTLRVRGAAADRIPDDPPRQRRAGDRLTIVRESLPEGLPAGLPPPGAERPGVAENADPSPFIESDDPAIAATAREIVGDERDPTRAARRIVEWVSAHMKQE